MFPLPGLRDDFWKGEAPLQMNGLSTVDGVHDILEARYKDYQCTDLLFTSI